MPHAVIVAKSRRRTGSGADAAGSRSLRHRHRLVIWRSAVGAAGRLFQVDQSVAVWVSEEEHRRGALEMYDLVVVQGDSRVAEASVGGLGVGGPEPYGHRDLAVRRQQHQADV